MIDDKKNSQFNDNNPNTDEIEDFRAVRMANTNNSEASETRKLIILGDTGKLSLAIQLRK